MVTAGEQRRSGDERVLVLRALGLGDLLTALPALRAIRRGYPDCRVVLAAPQPLHQLVRLGALADDTLPAEGLNPISWSGASPALAVNLHGKGPQSHRFLQTLAPGRLLAFGNDRAGHDGPPWVEAEHEVHRWCRLLGAYGVPADPSDLSLPAPERRPAVVAATIIHPGAGRPDKVWRAGRFRTVARALERAGHRVVVTGSPEERLMAIRVAVAAGLPEDRVLAGDSDLLDLAALVAAARLVVCGDTGIGHLATALGTPSVLIFGREHPDQWGPPVDQREHVVLRAANGRVGEITPDEVLAAVERLERHRERPAGNSGGAALPTRPLRG